MFHATDPNHAGPAPLPGIVEARAVGSKGDFLHAPGLVYLDRFKPAIKPRPKSWHGHNVPAARPVDRRFVSAQEAPR